MSAARATCQTLIGFGIDPVKAEEASKRYDDNVAAAVDWCFGPGMDWEPAPNPALPAAIAAPASTAPQHIEHREHHPPSYLTGSKSPGPPLPPRRTGAASPLPKTSSKPLASNNPFRSSGTDDPPPATRENTPAPPGAWTDHTTSVSAADSGALGVTVQDQDDDDMLAQAIRMSQQTNEDTHGQDDRTTVTIQPAQDVDMGDVDDTDDTDADRRAARERSVRASAPPPGSDADSGRTMFGPSTKEEMGQTALVPAGPPTDSNAALGISKEDEDMNRAIQDSLMTASMQSLPVKAPKVPRMDEAPLVFYSESNSHTYAANFLQALYAVPQLRRTILEGIVNGIEPHQAAVPLKDLARLFALMETETESYEDVDEIIKEITSVQKSSHFDPNSFQLPPKTHTEHLIQTIASICTALVDNTKRKKPDSAAELGDDSGLPELADPPSFVRFDRRYNVADNFHAHLADVLWWRPADADAKVDEAIDALGGDVKPDSLLATPDMLCVLLSVLPGAKREVWQLEEEIVLDRYMKENQVWATQLRAQQSVAAGTVRRLKERLEALTMYQGFNFNDSLATLITHYDQTASTPTTDPVQAASRSELKTKLEETLAGFKEKTAKLTAEMGVEEKKASGKVFETDDPDKNRYVYELRATLMHDGALVPGRHLYAYIKGDDGRWWKIQDHEINETTFKEMAADRTGLFMDGGPYCLVYARKGPRPTRHDETEAPLANEIPAENEAAPAADGHTVEVPSEVQAEAAAWSSETKHAAESRQEPDADQTSGPGPEGLLDGQTQTTGHEGSSEGNLIDLGTDSDSSRPVSRT